MSHIATPAHSDNIETTETDFLDGIEDVIYRLDELVDELGREIDLVTDELSEDAADAAVDLGCQADSAVHDIRQALAVLRAALTDEAAADD